MSQNESSSKNNLLMPLAIGGGLLLLFLSMNKAKGQTQEAANMPDIIDESAKNNLQPNSGQIVPEEAPKYTELMESEEEEQEASSSSFPSQSTATYPSPSYVSMPTSSFDTDDESSSNSEVYPFEQPIPKNNNIPKIKFNKNTNIIGQGKPKMGLHAQSDQARKIAERANTFKPTLIKGKSLHAQSDQAKWAQQKAKNTPNKLSPIPFVAQAQKAIAQNKQSSKIFPLKQGQTNNYIKEIQRKMGVSPTGFFGTQTRAALLKKYKVSEVSEVLYKQIITGKSLPKSNPTIVTRQVKRPKR